MEPLHAPWRIEYILAPKSADSDDLFVRLGQSSDDEANYVIARGRTCFAVLNAYPYTGGHVMVVPYRKLPDLNGLTDEEMLELMNMARRCQNALTSVMKPEGFNIGINLGKVAGAGIMGHVHIHIVPRWLGDTNFMAGVSRPTARPRGAPADVPAPRTRAAPLNRLVCRHRDII